MDFHEFCRKNMTVDDLPTKELREAAQLCGLSTIIRLLESMPRRTLVIPNDGFKKMAAQWLAKCHPQGTIKELSKQTGVSEKVIWLALNRKRKSVIGGSDEIQSNR